MHANYTLSLHDALPIWTVRENLTFGDSAISDEAVQRAATMAGIDGMIASLPQGYDTQVSGQGGGAGVELSAGQRSEEHTSELQSLTNLVCRLLLEKKNK